MPSPRNHPYGDATERRSRTDDELIHRTFILKDAIAAINTRDVVPAKKLKVLNRHVTELGEVEQQIRDRGLDPQAYSKDSYKPNLKAPKKPQAELPKKNGKETLLPVPKVNLPKNDSRTPMSQPSITEFEPAPRRSNRIMAQHHVFDDAGSYNQSRSATTEFEPATRRSNRIMAQHHFFNDAGSYNQSQSNNSFSRYANHDLNSWNPTPPAGTWHSYHSNANNSYAHPPPLSPFPAVQNRVQSQNYAPQRHYSQTPRQRSPQRSLQRKANGSVGWVRDAIIPPSAASGGVPDPTPAYRTQTTISSQRLPTPQPILLVMDLNGTLLHRPDRKRSSHFVPRPALTPFLRYILSHFKVMIWSSARPENVEKMCTSLFSYVPEAKGQLLATWGRDKMGLSADDYNKRVQCYKRLEKVWNFIPIQQQHPFAAQGGKWDQTNTVLIDDSLEKARTEPHNLVEIPEFDGKPEPKAILDDLTEYLHELLYQTNVSSYMRNNPYKLPLPIPQQPVPGTQGYRQ